MIVISSYLENNKQLKVSSQGHSWLFCSFWRNNGRIIRNGLFCFWFRLLPFQCQQNRNVSHKFRSFDRQKLNHQSWMHDSLIIRRHSGTDRNIPRSQHFIDLQLLLDLEHVIFRSPQHIYQKSPSHVIYCTYFQQDSWLNGRDAKIEMPSMFILQNLKRDMGSSENKENTSTVNSRLMLNWPYQALFFVSHSVRFRFVITRWLGHLGLLFEYNS